MFRPTVGEMGLIGLFLEGFLYGLYSGIFAIYLQYQTSKKDTNRTQNIIFYSMSALYVLSVAVFVCDIALSINPKFLESSLLCVVLIQTALFGCCDFIAQFTLIYRCWIVWGHNARIVVIPSILAVAFLVIWLVGGSSAHIFSDKIVFPRWGFQMSLACLSLSLAVNALVTGLIVFRIFKVFREVKSTSEDKILPAAGRNKLGPIILVLIESGMVLFSIQLARLVVTVVWTEASYSTLLIITAIHEMLNGITPTIIAVRTSIGLSFHDDKSTEEVAIESLCFASNHPNSIPAMGSVSVVDKDIKGDGDVDAQRSNDFDIVERST